MNIQRGVSLKDYSTMRLGGVAEYLVEVKTPEELVEALKWADENSQKTIIIGSGSNIIWQDEGFKGLVIVNHIRDFKKIAEDGDSAIYLIGSGEEWDDVVKKLVAEGLSGVESLSLIPGLAGATPVQNVGAYGQEIKDTLVDVEAYDTVSKKFVTIANKDCGFDYRTSRFKTTDKGRFFITHITLKLSKSKPKPPFYQSLQDYLDKHNITTFDVPTIRDAVIAIRTAKMPDWHTVANNGSFFANPIISKDQFESLRQKFPDINGWPYGEQVKIAAGWLIEKAGMKGMHDEETGMATWDKQALVLVNEKAHSTEDLLKFRQKIIDRVEDMFGIRLEQEPELIS